MAFRDSWHRALVYFGLAEERDPYEEEEPTYEPEAELEDRYRERPNVRRLGTRRRRDDFDDIFADDDESRASRPTTVLRSVRNGRSEVRVHLVIPKSFNDAQQVADKFKDQIPVVCADVDFPRAQALAAEVGGEAVASNAEVAQRADLVVLCHKPAQLEKVALEVAPHARAVVSILAATPLREVKAAYPGRPVYRVLPSTPVEVRQGAVILAADEPSGQPILDAQVRELFGELGTLVVLDDALIDVAMGLMSNAPAYYALVVEAQVDAGVRRGIPPRQASELVVQTMAGTAELIRRRDHDTLAVRRAVTSPGGSTARGLDALERGGLRTAFSSAMDAILRTG
jgi:pyrroline-5-carboxylate reductase